MTKKKIKEITIANNTMRFEYLQAIIDWNKKQGVEIHYQIKNNLITHCPRDFRLKLPNNISFSDIVCNAFFDGEAIEIKPKTFWRKIKYLFN